MKIIYKKTKKISPNKLYDLYKSVNWLEKQDKKDKGISLSKKYSNADVVISAWDKGKLVGIVAGLTDKIRNGAIFSLVVKKDHQRQGIGTKLLKKCSLEYPKIRWYLGANKKNIKFYKKAGFKLDKDPWFKKV